VGATTLVPGLVFGIAADGGKIRWLSTGITIVYDLLLLSILRLRSSPIPQGFIVASRAMIPKSGNRFFGKDHAPPNK